MQTRIMTKVSQRSGAVSNKGTKASRNLARTEACEGPWGSGSLEVRKVGKQALSPVVCGSWFQHGNSF